MGKSVYSVLLNDELVAALDEAAYQNGVSRSVMMDRILSNYLTVETPDLRMENILSCLGRIIGEQSGLRFINQPAVSMASVRSALAYKYKPTVKYAVELFRTGDELGKVKITLRTQSPVLMEAMADFFAFYGYLENKYIGRRKYFVEDGKFVRELAVPFGLNAEQTGEQIAFYIQNLDGAMKDYFSGMDFLEGAKLAIEAKYARTIAKCKV